MFMYSQQRQQFEIFTKLLNTGAHQPPRTPPLMEIGVNQSRELLNRPEGQAILQG